MENTKTRLSFLTRPDLKDEIAKLYNEGLTYTEIGKKIGGNRSQTAGLINRLKKAGVITGDREKTIKGPKRVRLPVQKTLKKRVDESDHATEPVFDHTAKLLFNKRVPLMELGLRQCRYPVYSNGSAHLFCGDVATGDTMYCQTHKDLCIVPAKILPKKHAIRK